MHVCTCVFVGLGSQYQAKGTEGKESNIKYFWSTLYRLYGQKANVEIEMESKEKEVKYFQVRFW